MKEHLLYLALGTNLGEKRRNIEEAYGEIEKRIGAIVSKSAFYITEPEGFKSGNQFVNTVCIVRTTLPVAELFSISRKIEEKLGRTLKSQNMQYVDRIIDIDILMYDDCIIHTPQLEIPHPRLHQRSFVLSPLKEVAPNVVHPVLGKKISQLADKLDNSME